MGVVVYNCKEFHEKLFLAAKTIGGSPSVFDCYLAVRGMKTMEARVKLHCKNAFIIAKYLE